ncbi:hypothetical protein [uncultured Algibacter sp.]|uniref:hypothetical protein n=1 Tax=uncultured Algibacter sp. TaxID=298659 RepID=UPI00263846E7|nr:hypothetical protein [uncultured Algibacter sp.]
MIKQNPFSLYDFLGYFIPGGLMIYLFLFIEYLENLESKFELKTFVADNSNFQLDKFLFFVIASYAIGHLLNFISSITIERYANWKYNYPSKYLLGFEIRGFWKAETRSGILWRILLLILIFPVTILDLVLGEVFGFKNFYTRKLDKFLIALIKFKGKKLINKLAVGQLVEFHNDNVRVYDFNRIISHYTFEHTKSHQFRMVNYVILYGFLRTLTLISIISFWYILIINFAEIKKAAVFLPLIIVGGISYIFFMAFMKFYRRYTLEGLMLIAIDENLK